MGFSEAIRTFYARYLDFEGRSRRAEYWWVQLVIFLLALVFAFIIGFSESFSATGEISAFGTIILLFGALIMLGHVIGLISLQVRRFHDLGQTGWLVLVFMIVGLIPLIGILTGLGQLIWFCFSGTKGPNKYGPDPIDPHMGTVFD
jgi:uncharacterized membrane protein YhaH (DUF805 family)